MNMALDYIILVLVLIVILCIYFIIKHILYRAYKCDPCFDTTNGNTRYIPHYNAHSIQRPTNMFLVLILIILCTYFRIKHILYKDLHLMGLQKTIMFYRVLFHRVWFK